MSLQSKTSLVAVLLLLASGCGGIQGPTVVVAPASAGEEADPALPVELSQAPETPGDASGDEGAELLSALPYADTPVTFFAEQMTRALLAAVRDEPLPQLPVPTALPIGPTGPDVQYQGSEARPVGELTVLGFGMEVDFVLKVGEPDPDGAPGTQDGQLRATIYLTRNGLRLLELRSSEMGRESGLPAPQVLCDLDSVGHDILQRVRDDTISQLFLGETERRILGNDDVWREVQEGRPSGEVLQRVRVMVDQFGPTPPITFRLDDGGILVRDEAGSVFTLSFDLDDDGSQVVLSADPFVRVQPLSPHNH